MNSRKDTATRRQMLARLGLAAGAAYVAPTMMGLNAARASGASGASGGGNSGPSGSGGGTSSNSGPSRSGGSNSGNSGPSRNRNGNDSGQTRANAVEMPRWMRQMLGI